MPVMTPDQYRRLLAEGTRTAKIATVRKDGRPHLAPVWFVLDGDNIVFTTGKNSVKGRTLLRDQRVSVCVDDESFPYAMAVVEGNRADQRGPGSRFFPGQLDSCALRRQRQGRRLRQAQRRCRRTTGSGAVDYVIAIDKLAGWLVQPLELRFGRVGQRIRRRRRHIYMGRFETSGLNPGNPGTSGRVQLHCPDC